MAEDVLALMIYTNYEEQNLISPKSTPIKKIKLSRKEFVTYIVCDTTKYRRQFGTKAVKKRFLYLNGLMMLQSMRTSTSHKYCRKR